MVRYAFQRGSSAQPPSPNPPLPTCLPSLKPRLSQPHVSSPTSPRFLSPPPTEHRDLRSRKTLAATWFFRPGMAQREDGKELKVPENLTLCANSCGRPGSPATKNMCPSCFHQAALSLNPSSCSGHEKPPRSAPARAPERPEGAAGVAGGDERGGGGVARAAAAADPSAAPPPARRVNRCAGCWRKVGLTGFRCRCGETFCAEHRYSDRHGCSYDYRAAGREAIERENPVVKAAKIVRI